MSRWANLVEVRDSPWFWPVGERVIRYHGERCAQLEVNQSIRNPLDTSYPWWFTLMNWVLFYSPHVYAKRLKDIWVDQQVNYQPWRRFVEELQDDWHEYIIPVGFSYQLGVERCLQCFQTAVVLTANVGFLAIQSIDTGHANRSAGQIMSYISLLLSLGSIFACIILGRQHRIADHRFADGGVSSYVVRIRS